MSDIYNISKRSEIMSKISGKETKPEIFVRKFLFENGFRYRKNVKELPGKPDIVLPKYKIAIFIHGCFWHGHHCKAGKLPETRKEFWEKKISDNAARDKKNMNILVESGLKVIVIWQCEINSMEKRAKAMKELYNAISNKS
jgi:DNA mismatch endonuclease, patch repair protein